MDYFNQKLKVLTELYGGGEGTECLVFLLALTSGSLTTYVLLYKASQLSSLSTPSFTVGLESSILKVSFPRLHTLVCADPQSLEHNTLKRKSSNGINLLPATQQESA